MSNILARKHEVKAKNTYVEVPILRSVSTARETEGKTPNILPCHAWLAYLSRSLGRTVQPAWCACERGRQDRLMAIMLSRIAAGLTLFFARPLRIHEHLGPHILTFRLVHSDLIESRCR